MLLVASKGGRLTGDDGVGKTAARNLATAVPYVGDGLTSVFIHIHPVLPGLQHAERDVRRVDLVIVLVVDMTYVQNERSLRQADLRGVIIEGEKGDSGLRAQANGRGTNVDFGAGIFVRPQVVARHHGPIGNRGNPIIFARGSK